MNEGSSIFKSKNGRVFQSNDGITPDLKLMISNPKSELVKSIEQSNLAFQFAVEMRRKYGKEIFLQVWGK